MDPNFTGAATHPNELMNPGRTVPAGNNPFETTRQFISDLDVQLLADAYGYTVALPSTLDTAHAMLDSLTGTLLVQGSARNFTTGAGVNDTINLQRVIDAHGDNILVNVNGSLERVQFAEVRDIVIHRNGGTDTVTVNPNVTQPWQEVQFVVSSNDDDLEDSTSVGGSSTTNGIVDLSSVIPGSQTTLRAAIVEANISDGAIYVGRGTYNLTLTGSGGTTQGDLDITGDVTIVGAGAGATIIDAGGPTGINDRIFQLIGSSQLDLSKVTLTGGNSTSGGGAILLTSGGVLSISDSTLVENHADQHGSAVRNISGTVDILNSVFVGNTSNYNTGALASSSTDVALTIGNTIFAHNSYDLGGGSINRDVFIGPGNNTNLGNNLLSSSTGAMGFFSTSGANPDYFGSVDYVVTSLVDSFDANRTTDLTELSLRESIDLANNHTNGTNPDEIWLPAWNFVLTRDRETYGQGSATDVDVAFGDLDISDSLRVRGISMGVAASSTQVRWRLGVVDAVFDLLGDFNGTGLTGSPDDGDVDGRDFLVYQRTYGSTTDLRADGNDDGIINGDDGAIWSAKYGNSLALTDLIVTLV